MIIKYTSNVDEIYSFINVFYLKKMFLVFLRTVNLREKLEVTVSSYDLNSFILRTVV